MPRLPKGPPLGQPTAADPAHVKVVDDDLDALDDLLPEPKRRKGKGDDEPPEPRSQLGIRADGAFMLSVEDAEGCNLRGRELVTFVILTDDEECLARTLLSDPLCEVAARLIGRLPRHK